ncbi:MAG: phosphatase PAP2 family protein [Polyangiaceae bacterium]
MRSVVLAASALVVTLAATTAHAAEPTNPSRKDRGPAYQLRPSIDLPVVGIGLVMASTRLFRAQPAYCAPLCDRVTLNALDRTTAGSYDSTWSTASTVGLVGVAAASAVYLVADERFVPAMNDAVVVLESALTAVGISSVASIAAGRPRPFLFGEKAPLDVRNSADASMSFVSSHAAVTFAVGISTFITAEHLRPTRPLVPALVLIAGLASASFVTLGQVEAGNHFVTDAIAGAVVGASSGILVPALHDAPFRLVPIAGPREGALQLVGTF